MVHVICLQPHVCLDFDDQNDSQSLSDQWVLRVLAPVGGRFVDRKSMTAWVAVEVVADESWIAAQSFVSEFFRSIWKV